MTNIKLQNAAWSFDDSAQLGNAGGFGEVFKGTAENGNQVAVKRLKLTAGKAAYRELAIGEWLSNQNLQNVVPVLDFGQDADSDRYFIVMPVCEYSLEQEILKCGKFTLNRTKETALNIISGLLEAKKVVHRDLKPSNILWHNGTWKIADFGISKFIEDATSQETLRESLTPAYAAPEQWRGAPPSPAIDVYALGCIIHTMLNGKPPFLGAIDLRQAHLNEIPPILSAIPRLNSLTSSMLRKAPQTRPSLDVCACALQQIGNNQHISSREELAAAGAQVARVEAEKEATASKRQSEIDEWNEIARAGVAELGPLVSRLFDEIAQTCEAAKISGRTIRMGKATLSLDDLQPRSYVMQNGSQPDGWKIAASATISISTFLDRVAPNDPEDYKFTANLLFATNKLTPTYRWFELSFFNLSASHGKHSPVALQIDSRAFQLALSNLTFTWQVASGPWMIDLFGEEAFNSRWTKLFAKAAIGILRPPSYLPIQQSFYDT